MFQKDVIYKVEVICDLFRCVVDQFLLQLGAESLRSWFASAASILYLLPNQWKTIENCNSMRL